VEKFMGRLASSLVVLVLLLTHSGLTCLAVPGVTDLEAEEYAVYSALIEEALPVELVVINDRTAPTAEPHYLSGMSLKETYESYKAKDERSYSLERRFDLKVKYELVSSNEDIMLLMTKFAAWHPRGRGCLLFSRVGLNREKTEALVYVRVYRTPDARADGYLLKKKNGTWKVKRARHLWIA